MVNRSLRATAALGAAFLLLGASLGSAATAAPRKAPDTAKFDNGVYIVQMADRPVVAYDGGVAGYAATRPARGQKIDPLDPKVARYKDFLASRHDAALQRVGGGRKLYSYGFVFNGFAAKLTRSQAAALGATPGVVAVSKDELRQLSTSTTPAFLGLDQPNGLWAQLGGAGAAGEGVVIGIIDSGIWPEHPSFSDRDSRGKLVFQQIPGWNGRCRPGEQFPASKCNQKLVAAQWFNAGFGGDAAVKAEFPYEFASARDADGHGSHTASTAGGNAGVTPTGEASVFGRMSGIAPRARIAAYKTCWGNGGEGGCPNSDNVAAIDQAVADGVDVINYSISGTSTNFRDPVEIAFLFAADAGVFVAASAGNSGPGASTVAHPSPWLTTVAASGHNRGGNGAVKLGDGRTFTGASLAKDIPAAPLANSTAIGLAGASPAEVDLCYPGTLDPAKTAGKVVVCKRGVIGRTEKSRAVQIAGGVGMILYNSPSSSVNADFHWVPTVHVDTADGEKIVTYAATAGATADIAAATIVNDALAPVMASFSSRGPLLAGNGDLLKPDITAPGVDVLAAVSPIGYNGRLFDLLSGTSMSSPHVAGLAALFKDLYPNWSPMAIKSALMTTAYQTTKTGTPLGAVFGTPFSFGAGHADPNRATNPGLVFDSGYADWLGFLCGTQLPASFCTGVGVPVLDPSNLNVPSIAIGDLAGSQTVTRRVTNVGGLAATYSAAPSGLVGIGVTVSPASFTLAPGASQVLSITFTNVSAALNAYVNGAITWTGSGGHVVRIPTVVRPVALAAPTSVSGNGSATSYPVTFGYTGMFTATARGLVAADVTPGTVSQDPDQSFSPADPTGFVAIAVTIPAGTTYARFALFDADVAPGADLDLYVYQGATLVGSSGGGTSAEEVNFSFATPTGGPIALTVYVHGWGVPAGTSPFKLHQWSVPGSPAGNMTVTAPASATLGATGTIGLSFTGLAPATRYLGTVVYGGAAGMPAPTLIQVNTP